ncbi:hypothetical protein QQF64_009097 [Cirrhinus molitorella]|uniref:ribonuclease H n=1 Tax=Cirrhinus molitorella TaxID=172907 RepID=A0ABR3M1T3_9TELE
MRLTAARLSQLTLIRQLPRRIVGPYNEISIKPPPSLTPTLKAQSYENEGQVKAALLTLSDSSWGATTRHQPIREQLEMRTRPLRRAAEQRTEKQKQLKEMQKTFQQRIQQREKDVHQLRETVESHKRSAQTAVEDSEMIFTELIRSIERSRSELIRLIRDQEKAAVSRTEGRLERLKQEISDLRRRDAELEQLSHTQDHIQFLQLRDKLEDFCKELKKIPDKATFTNIVLWTRNHFLQYSHQLTLDLNTVYKRLGLSESNRVITEIGTVQSYPDHPDRFDVFAQEQLKEMQKTFQQRIQQREKDLQQLRETVESHKRSAQTAVEDSERIFTELIRSIERSRSELIRLIRDQEKAAVSRAEGRLERLEQEINDLRRRDAELEQLSHTQDHIQFLQSFQSLSAPPESTDVNDDLFSSLVSFDDLRECVHQLRDKLEDLCKEELKNISDRVTSTNNVLWTRNDFLQCKSCFALTAVEDSERIFTELIRSSIERSRSELIQLIRDQEKAAVSRAEGRLERLEQEINDLRRRDAELEQLSHTQDHIQFLQSFQSLSAPPESTDVNDGRFISTVSFDGLRESVCQMRDKLEDFCKEELKKISDRVTSTNIVPRTRNDFLRYSHQLTLDLNTVNQWLRLSENNRVYMDNILVCGSTMEKHYKRLSIVLDTIQKSGLKLNQQKCKLKEKEINFLGHRITGESISPHPDRVTAITAVEPPQNQIQLRRMLGMVNFLGRYLPHLSSVLYALNDPPKANVAKF